MSNPDTLLYKIDMCIDYQMLYALEDDFNEVGLTAQRVDKDRMILCKIKDNKPHSDIPITDYIYIGGLNSRDVELSERAASKLKLFITSAKGAKSTIKNMKRSWQDGLRMYEASIPMEDRQRDGVISESKEYQILES